VRPTTGWRRSIAALLVAAVAAAPALLALAALVLAWRAPDLALWPHLLEHVLPSAFVRTLALGVGVAAGTLVVGGGLAVLTTLCEFPLRRVLAVALVLPLAIPTYVLAFVYVGVFDYGGTIALVFRALTGEASALPSLRNLPGAIVVLTLALYPYVYLIARAALARQGGTLLEAARSQGLAPRAAFVRAVLPAIRPALVAGTSLAVMEALADFGAVAVLGVDTLSTAVYKTWYALGSLPGAAQLATLLLALVAVAVVAERGARRGAGYAARALKPAPRLSLAGTRAAAATAACALVVAAALLLPVAQLAWWGTRAQGVIALAAPIASTALVAGGAAVLVLATGAALVAAVRMMPGSRVAAALRELAGLGYAVPGTVLAVGVMLALIRVDAALALGGALASGLAGVWIALVARLQRMGTAPLDAALTQIKPSFRESARTQGLGRLAVARRVDWPLLKPALLASLLLVFVEAAKELPATLMLRPLGYDTLAVKIYNATSEGLWMEAALPALLLVALGLVPSAWLLRR